MQILKAVVKVCKCLGALSPPPLASFVVPNRVRVNYLIVVVLKGVERAGVVGVFDGLRPPLFAVRACSLIEKVNTSFLLEIGMAPPQ